MQCALAILPETQATKMELASFWKIKLQKNLLQLACRHHILELILANVINEAIRCTSAGPVIAIFKRYKHYWNKIDQSAYGSATSNAVVMEALGDEDNVTQFAVNQLQVTQVRDDRRQLLELAIIFLGGIPLREVCFIYPGALQHA
ncbi:hypothetical protein PR048_023556 [Dryococelus australis]|uniref:Uncharacterized protein n=1 Tax=Dryococelus australis TaxID=614101 RepID=A0ABQ9GUE5_9NEOP|nr:hypothetical protein PR048_023556 [Dryococelus australis]